MIRKKRFWKLNETKLVSTNKSRFIILMCIGLTAIVVFSTINIQFAAADITETVYCTTCHEDDMPNTWITVTIDSQTTGDITYDVTGSDTFDGEEGWAVFDSLENNIESGYNSGTFTLPKDGETYRVFWVDNGTGGGGTAGGGTAYEDITTPNDSPEAPNIDGPKGGKAGTSYKYKFSSEDPQEQDIFYKINWGDGQELDWFGPYASGEEVTKSHTWSDQGTYTIKAWARDIYGAESEAGTLVVEMPKNKAFNINILFMRFLEQHPNLFPVLRYLLALF